MLKNLLLLSGFSAFAVIVILSFNIYHNYTISSLPKSTQKKVINIPSTFDKKTLSELKKRSAFPVDLFEQTKVLSEDKNPSQTNSSQSATPL